MSTVSLVAGASGLVGAALQRALASQGTPHLVSSSMVGSSWHLDLASPDDVAGKLRAAGVQVVYCAASIPSVERCQLEPQETARVNVEGSIRLAEACARAGARMVFFSTEYVFAGDVPGPSGEDAACAPINTYGMQKRAVEQALLDMRAGHLVVRTSAVYGPERARKNFVLQLVDAAKAGRRVKVAVDQVVTPTHVDALAAGCVLAMERGAEGVLHLAGPTVVGRVEFAQLACSVLHLAPETVEACTTASMGLAAPRPRWAALSTAKAAEMGLPLWSPQDGLERMKRWLDDAAV